MCRYPEFQETFGCHQDHPTPVPSGCPGWEMPGKDQQLLTLGTDFLKTNLSFPQTGVDPGKVYLARRKFVKRQAKGTAQAPAKLPKFLLRENKVTQLQSSQQGPRVHECDPNSPSNSSWDFLHSFPGHISHLSPPFLPTFISIPPQTLRCRRTGSGWEQEGWRGGWNGNMVNNLQKPGNSGLFLWACVSSKVPFQSPFLSHPSPICVAMLSSSERNESRKLSRLYPAPRDRQSSARLESVQIKTLPIRG